MTKAIGKNAKKYRCEVCGKWHTIPKWARTADPLYTSGTKTITVRCGRTYSEIILEI